MIRPGKTKGWVYHEHQHDRIVVSCGFLKWVLYDQREESPTFKMINEITMSERNRKLLLIPRRVVHAVHNIGACVHRKSRDDQMDGGGDKIGAEENDDRHPLHRKVEQPVAHLSTFKSDLEEGGSRAPGPETITAWARVRCLAER